MDFPQDSKLKTYEADKFIAIIPTFYSRGALGTIFHQQQPACCFN
jgi:hypothetical protein